MPAGRSGPRRCGDGKADSPPARRGRWNGFTSSTEFRSIDCCREKRRCLPFEGPSPPRPSSPRGRGGRKTKKKQILLFFLPPLPRGEEGRGGEGPSKGRHRRLPQEN